MLFCPTGIFGAHHVKRFHTFIAAVAEPCCFCHVWADCGCCRCVVVRATLGDENPAHVVICVVFVPMVQHASVIRHSTRTRTCHQK